MVNEEVDFLINQAELVRLGVKQRQLSLPRPPVVPPSKKVIPQTLFDSTGCPQLFKTHISLRLPLIRFLRSGSKLCCRGCNRLHPSLKFFVCCRSKEISPLFCVKAQAVGSASDRHTFCILAGRSNNVPERDRS